MEEWREKAYHNSKIYKERVKRWHDKRIKKKEFAPGDKVLHFNSRVKLFGHGKLQSKWEGPFKVINSSSHRAITLQNDEGTLFKVNGQRLKLFLEPNKELEEMLPSHGDLEPSLFNLTFLGHTYIFLKRFASRNALEKVGPQRGHREGGRPDQVGGRPALVPPRSRFSLLWKMHLW